MRLLGLSLALNAVILCGCDGDERPSGTPTDTDSTSDTTDPVDSGSSQPPGHGGASNGGDDAGKPSGSDAPDALCGERPSGTLWGDHVLRFENADEGVTVQLRRAYAGAAAGESSLFELQAFALEIDEATYCSDASSSLSYMNSHHNWNDVATGHLDGRRYTVELTFSVVDQAWVPVLTGHDGSGDVVFGPIPLTPTGGPIMCYSCPNYTPVYISEVMTANTSTIEDESGAFVPWIEICNPSASDVQLDGWWLSDDLLDRQRWALPALNLERHQCLVLFADGEPSKGERHTSFELTAGGGALVLTDPDGVTDGGFLFGALPADRSLQWSWEHNAYRETNTPTPGVPDWDD